MAQNFEISPKTLQLPCLVSKELHSLITTVSNLETGTTLQKVLDGLKLYIAKNKLFDPINPSKIVCKNDNLSIVFGVSEFSLIDLKKILQKLVVIQFDSVNSFPDDLNSGVKGDSAMKRTLNDDEKSYGDFEEKRFCERSNSSMNLNDSLKDITDFEEKRFRERANSPMNPFNSSKNLPMVLLIPPSPKYDFSDSPESIQDYETELAKDTSDLSYSWSDAEEDFFFNEERATIITAEETFDVEYEIDSFSEQEYVFDSDSDEDAVNTAIITVLQKSESDFEFWADQSSEGEDYYDLEISESDRWLCKTCGSFNKPPMRFCLRCFDQRSGWLPEKKEDFKKRRTAKRKRQRSKAKTTSQDDDKESILLADGIHMQYQDDSGCLFQKESPVLQNSLKVDVCESSPCSASSTANFQNSSQNGAHSSSLSQGSSLSSLTSFSSLEASSLEYIHNASVDKSLDVSALESYRYKHSDLQSIPSQMGASSSSLSQESSHSSLFDITSSSGQDHSSLEFNVNDKLCLICCTALAKASIVHGKFAHQVTCYKCARKLQKIKKPCPICRRTIERVVHQISGL